MSKRVAVMYTTDDSTSVSCVHGERSVILVEGDDEVDVTAVNMDGFDDIEEVLQEALETVRRRQRILRLVSSPAN